MSVIKHYGNVILNILNSVIVISHFSRDTKQCVKCVYSEYTFSKKIIYSMSEQTGLSL